MRRSPCPLSVTRPSPSSTTRLLVLTTLAVAFIWIVTGSGPQRNLMTPPFLTAVTTAFDVQLAAVPVPTHRVGSEVSTACACAGTGTSLAPRSAAPARTGPA